VAENESLDLNSGQASRWIAVLTAVRKGEPCQKVGAVTSKVLLTGLRNTLRQFAEYGVTVADFLANQQSPEILSELVRRTKGHAYAKLLVSVLDTSPNAPNGQCLHDWIHAILDKMFDQIDQRAVGHSPFHSFHEARSFSGRVRHDLQNEIERIAANLCDPQWKPSVRRTRGEPKVDATAELLSMSLVGGARQ
jgi:hypothetical protein